jgi:diguanylate cyclase (GGDEF)-like protein/PAS domain S-box-containing protein
LRQRAEQTLTAHASTPAPLAEMPPLVMERMVHELRVHQIELEMQNDELRRAQMALEGSRASYADLYDNAPVAYLTVSKKGMIVQANLTAAALLGVAHSELLRQTLSHFICRDDQDAFYLLFKRALANAQAQVTELRMLKADKQAFWARLVATAAQDPVGAQTLRVVVSDIVQYKADQENLQLAASVFSRSREGIMITDTSGSIVNVNDAFSRITGYSRDEALGQNPRMMSSGHQSKAFYMTMWHNLRDKDHWYGEMLNRRKNGEMFTVLQSVTTVHDAQGKATHYVAQFSDITTFKAQQSRLEHIAHYDLLTNLPNRALLADRLHQSMAQVLRRGGLLGVAFIDLDSFKTVNDHHGHEVGDQLLIALANRMKETLREGDTLARIGGDEFVAVLSDLPSEAACLPMLTRLLETAHGPVQFGEVSVQVSASLGVSFYPQAGPVEADQLLRQADQAMYRAKQTGKNRFHVFDSAQDRSVRVHHASLERIRLALAQQELVLYYQPKVNMRTGQVIGAEALIRWQHPERGLLAPAEFLPVFEDDPFAVEVGEWVLDTALNQIAQWQTQGLDMPVSVNIGSHQLQQTDFVARLAALLARHPQVAPAKLELEVLETSALQDMGYATQVIEECHQMGVAFALDDFGTGYSSLTYLKRLRVALIKIDQSFVRDMLADPDDLSILKGVIGLASAFHRQVIAEGVETIRHGSVLLTLGCDLAQGYGIARPMPAAALPDWVANWRPDVAWSQVRG